MGLFYDESLSELIIYTRSQDEVTARLSPTSLTWNMKTVQMSISVQIALRLGVMCLDKHTDDKRLVIVRRRCHHCHLWRTKKAIDPRLLNVCPSLAFLLCNITEVFSAVWQFHNTFPLWLKITLHMWNSDTNTVILNNLLVKLLPGTIDLCE